MITPEVLSEDEMRQADKQVGVVLGMGGG